MSAGSDDRDARPDLGTEIAQLYSGSLDTFVARRNALVKRLRDAGRRDDAGTVKQLRKPRKLAWALNLASLAEPESLEAVEAAVAATVRAQSGAGDLRTSLSQLRRSTAGLAETAARIAGDGGPTFDSAELANAVMAVIGTRDAFDLLRTGRLTEIPEAGGLDLLSLATEMPRPAPPSDAGTPPAASGPDPALIEAVRRVEARLESAIERLASAQRSLADSEADAADAERLLRLARREAAVRQAALDAARSDVDEAARQVRDAEAAVTEARIRLNDG